jgi:hemolysin D
VYLTNPIANLYGRLIDRNDEREFLPAALEVVATPPSPTGRLLGLLIIVFFGIAALWSLLGRVDIIATATGRIAPAGEVKTIQPLDPGIVRAIDVQDGDHVHAGQLLVELDPTQPGADRDQSERDMIHAQLDVARLSALNVAAATGHAPQMMAPPDAPADLVGEARTAMLAQAAQHAAKMGDLTQQIQQRSAEAAEYGASIEKTRAAIPMLAEKERIHRELTSQGYGTSLSYLDAQQQLSDARHDINVQSSRAAQAYAAREALERQRQEAQSEYVATILSDLRKAQEQANEFTQQWVKARNRVFQTKLLSPIDGVVEQMTIHTLRGVVTPAQRLMIVVPDTRKFFVEAQLENRDVGFVRPGQPVKVKIETFNFTRYGMIDGRVIKVSRDAVPSDDPQPGNGMTSPRTTPAPGSSGSPHYTARIALSRTTMEIDGRTEPLVPGMAVTAEIKTGNRTIIDYLLSPLARKTNESLHER